MHTLLAPNCSNLTVIRWKNEKGEVKEFKLKDSVIDKLSDIGYRVVPKWPLEVWEEEKDPRERCDAVFSYWLDHPCPPYPVTWEGLYKLLDDSKLGQVATELKLWTMPSSHVGQGIHCHFLPLLANY